jgi:hypothetical protein
MCTVCHPLELTSVDQVGENLDARPYGACSSGNRDRKYLGGQNCTHTSVMIVVGSLRTQLEHQFDFCPHTSIQGQRVRYSPTFAAFSSFLDPRVHGQCALCR